MATIRDQSILLLFASILTKCSGSTNLIQNGGFEGDEYWDMTERSSMWSVDTIKDDKINFSTSNPHSEERSVTFEPVPNLIRYNAVWISQYVLLDEFSRNKEEYLRISFWTFCDSGSKLRLQMDVNYVADHRLTVKRDCLCVGEFTHNCLTIPPYGRVRAVMVHLISEHEHEKPFYVDDVNLRLTRTLQPHCPMHLDTIPKIRHIMTSFLQPVIQDDSNEITVCTQLTFDRLPHLIETSKIWKGPISASILILGDSRESFSTHIKKLMADYYAEKALYSHVTFHVVFEDMVNKEDDIMYPVNFLRNIALQNAHTPYVFYLDADVIPRFSEHEAKLWLITAKEQSDIEHLMCIKCAFIAPVFNLKCKTCTLPETKAALLERIETGDIEVFGTVSHSVVQYRKWYTATQSYRVSYRQDIEPYFIVSRDAPLMYSWYAGYGRDKCAYSKDLHESGFTFHVLPQAYLLNKKEIKGSQTIMNRSRGLKLDTFLTIAFHNKDLENHFITTSTSFNPYGGGLAATMNQHCNSLSSQLECERSADVSTACGDETKPRHHQYTEHAQDRGATSEDSDQLPRRSHSLEQSDGNDLKQDVTSDSVQTADTNSQQRQDGEATRGDGVQCNQVPSAETLELAQLKLIRKVPRDRLEIFIETLMRKYGTYVYVEKVGPNSGYSTSMHAHLLELVHPVAVIVFQDSSDQTSVTSDQKQKIVKYTMPDGHLARIKHDYPDPILLLLSVDEESSIVEQFTGYLKSLSDNDIVVIKGAHLAVLSAHKLMCSEKPNWELFLHNGEKIDFITLKSPGLFQHHPLKEIEKPAIMHMQAPTCANLKTDVVLMTKNRPLQTFAFLESLNNLATGVQTVWVFYDSTEHTFNTGYEYSRTCSNKFSFETKLVAQNEHFGRELLDVFERSDSDCVVVGVDEMVWLKPMDLAKVCCYLHTDNSLGSAQLRMGSNLFNTLGDKRKDFVNNRFHLLDWDRDMYVYYPEFMPYDFGYVLNTDGMMVRREQFLRHFSDVVRNSVRPAQFEGGMIHVKLREYVRKWHLTYSTSRLVNNMYLQDGRVEKTTVASEGSHELVNKFVKENKKLDVSKYASENQAVMHAHHSKPIGFIQNDC